MSMNEFRLQLDTLNFPINILAVSLGLVNNLL